MKFPWELCRENFSDWYKEGHLPCSRETTLPHSPPTPSSDGEEDPPEDPPEGCFPSSVQLQTLPRTTQTAKRSIKLFTSREKKANVHFTFYRR